MSPHLIIHRLQRVRTLTAIGTVVVALAFGAAGMSSAQAADGTEVKQEISQTLDAIKGYAADKRDDAISAGKDLIHKLDARMEALEANMESMGEKASDATKAKWRDTKAGLISLREKTAAKLDEMQDASADAWSDAKDGFSHAVHEFGESLEKAGEELQS